MAALVIEAPGRLGSTILPIPDRAPGCVLVRPRYVGLCGTDLELLHGTASYFRDGRAGYPHVFGHEWWGEVIATDSIAGIAQGDPVIGHTMVSCGLCSCCQQGRRQLCQRMAEVGLYSQQGAAAEYIRLPAHALTRLPDALAAPWAVLVEPAVTVVEALERAGCGLADRVAVVGTGTVGLLAVQLAGRRAGRVEAIGVDPAGLELAVRCGAAAMHMTDDAPMRAYSLVVEASGAPSAFLRSLQLVADGGRVAVIGVANDPVDGMVPGEIALRGISVHGIRHGLDHYEQTVQLFADGVFDGDCLVATVMPAVNATRAFELLAHGRSGRPKVILDLTGPRRAPR
ncbi:MAG: zinc-dependent alcohol dehydrogenase [Pseudonocardiaceae bacterium]